MGNPYDHQFFLGGSGCSHGEMVCSGCRQPIFNFAHDWMYYKKSESYGLAVHCFHRDCWLGHDGWREIDAKNAKVKSRNVRFVDDLKLVAEVLRIDRGLEKLPMSDAAKLLTLAVKRITAAKFNPQ